MESTVRSQEQSINSDFKDMWLFYPHIQGFDKIYKISRPHSSVTCILYTLNNGRTIRYRYGQLHCLPTFQFLGGNNLYSCVYYYGDEPISFLKWCYYPSSIPPIGRSTLNLKVGSNTNFKAALSLPLAGLGQKLLFHRNGLWREIFVNNIASARLYSHNNF